MSRILLIVLLCFGSLHAEKYTLSVAAIFQNEAPFMQEWLEYHHSKGVEHFYLYNNNSTDNFREVLSSWIEDGIVDLLDWPSVQEENDWYNYSFKVQISAYNHAISYSNGVSKWLALIDLDEFIVCNNLRNIAELLEGEFSNVSGLCVNWQCFGTSKIGRVPDGRILKHLVWKMRWDHEWNRNSKSIVRPKHIKLCVNPHYCLYKSGYWAVDSNGMQCDQCCTSVLLDKIRINHYWTRDEDFFWNVKVPRYKKWGNNIQDILKHANEMNEEYDPIMLEYFQ